MSTGPALHFLVLGDAYSTGTGASAARRAWPTLVGRRLSQATGRLVSLSNRSQASFTTDDIVRFGLPELEAAPVDLLTLCVGAQDIRAGRARWQYEAALQWILDAIAARGVSGERVVVAAIPRFDGHETVRLAVDGFNAVAEAEASARGFAFAPATAALGSGGREFGVLDDAAHAVWAEAVWNACRGAFVAADSPGAV